MRFAVSTLSTSVRSVFARLTEGGWFRGKDLARYFAIDRKTAWEYLQKFPFSELFVSPLAGPRQDETGLETILRMVRLRLTSIQVEILDNVGQPTGGFMPSREFEILQDAGIRVDAWSAFCASFLLAAPVGNADSRTHTSAAPASRRNEP